MKISAAPMSLPDALRTLGLKSVPSAAEAKKIYRDLALANHPDRGGSTDAMQLINTAYDTVSKAAENQVSRKSYEEERADYERGSVARAAIVDAEISKNLDPQKFAAHFQSVIGVPFTFKVEDNATVHNWTRAVTWIATSGTPAVFRLYVSVDLHSLVAKNLLGGGDVSFKLMLHQEIQYGTRSAKFSAKPYLWTSDHNTIMDPEVLFPAKKLLALTKGKEDKRKFSKRDMQLGLQNLGARDSSAGNRMTAWIYLPPYKVVIERFVLGGEAAWNLWGVQNGKEVRKGQYQIVPESDALLVALKEMVDNYKNTDTIDDVLTAAEAAFAAATPE